jgi:HSP20 family protein
MNKLATLNPFRVSRWDPAREFNEMQDRMSSFFDRFPLRLGNGQEETLTLTDWEPLVDISEDSKEYLIKVELPEIKKEDVKISVEDGVITISGERKFEKEEKDKKYHRVERAYGSFTRSFTVPEKIKSDQVDAEFKNGVLEVRLPKDEKAKAEALEIKVK